MKILQSEGGSYTEISTNTKKLERGIRSVSLAYQIPSELVKDGDRVEPKNLAEYVGAEPALALRQTIAFLDKTIRKPKSLWYFQSEAYLDRAELAEELRVLLWGRFAKQIRNKAGDKGMDLFQRTWNWKAHPYARFDVMFNNPSRDRNAEFMKQREDAEDSTKVWQDFLGRWFPAFCGITVEKKPNWKETAHASKPDWKTVANAIDKHLWIQELTIIGEQKIEIDKGSMRKTGKGFITARGSAMASSATDARIERPEHNKITWTKAEERHYFTADHDDVAATIQGAIIAMLRTGNRIPRSLSGDLLYKHFGELKEASKTLDEASMKKVWNLHNHVRQYYQQLFKSDRFRRACAEADFAHVEKIVPADTGQLIRILTGREGNQEMSEFIRLGKLIVHAADLPAGVDPTELNKTFQERLNYFVTSDGQSEIKRNEAFTRVWRNAVGLSYSSLKAWIDPSNAPEPKSDIFSKNISAKIIQNIDTETFKTHSETLFGNRKIEDRSRQQIISGKTEIETKEIAWGFLRLAAQLRHRVNHFATKNRLISVLKDSAVSTQNKNNLQPFSNRLNDEVSEPTLGKFRDLLDFDLALQHQGVVDKLNQVKANSYLDDTQLPAVIEACASPGSAPFPIPRFSSVLKQMGNLIAYNPSNQSKVLVALGRLGPLFKEEKYTPTFLLKTNLLRMIYQSAFSNWLNDVSKETCQLTLNKVVAAQHHRKKNASEEDNRFYAVVQDITAQLDLQTADDLMAVMHKITAKMAREEHLNESYGANSKKQKSVSNRIERFKLELFGNLYAQFLKEQKLGWLAEFDLNVEPKKGGEPLTADIVDKHDGLETEDWHAAFYAWLYLVPTSDISRLRNQFMKTEVLEGKGTTSTENPETIAELKVLQNLMSLYMNVYDAGFDGTEPLVPSEIKGLLYESEDSFTKVYSTDMEDHHHSVPGIRRGLRKLNRFGHGQLMAGIFKKHKITDEEVDLFCSLNDTNGTEGAGDTPTAAQKLKERNDDRKMVLDSYEKSRERGLKPYERKRLDNAVKSHARRYKVSAAAMAAHDFQVNAGRLGDHARLHGLLMKVIGRLLDYTLLWERDSKYAYLGMLARQIGIENLSLIRSATSEALKKKDGVKKEVGARYGLAW